MDKRPIFLFGFVGDSFHGFSSKSARLSSRSACGRKGSILTKDIESVANSGWIVSRIHKGFARGL